MPVRSGRNRRKPVGVKEPLEMYYAVYVAGERASKTNHRTSRTAWREADRMHTTDVRYIHRDGSYTVDLRSA